RRLLLQVARTNHHAISPRAQPVEDVAIDVGTYRAHRPVNEQDVDARDRKNGSTIGPVATKDSMAWCRSGTKFTTGCWALCTRPSGYCAPGAPAGRVELRYWFITSSIELYLPALTSAVSRSIAAICFL